MFKDIKERLEEIKQHDFNIVLTVIRDAGFDAPKLKRFLNESIHDRAELIQLVEEARIIVQKYYNHDTFDDCIARDFLKKLE